MSGVDDRPRQLVIRTERDEGDRVLLTVQDAGGWFRKLKMWRDSSKHSTPPREAAWGSAFPSAAPSSRVIMAGYGQRPKRWSGSHVFIFYSSATRGCEGRPQSWRHLDACCNRCAARDEESVMVERFTSCRSWMTMSPCASRCPTLLREFGFAVQAFSSAEEFPCVRLRRPDRMSDPRHRHAGMSGPDLQRELALRPARRFRSSSSPLTEMKPSVRACSKQGCRGVPVQSHSAIRALRERAQCRFFE